MLDLRVVVLAVVSGFCATGAMAGEFPECQEKVQMAAEEGIFTTIEVTSRGVEVGTDPGTWRRVDYGTKIGMVRALSCMITEGSEDEQARIVILNSKNHKVMGEGPPGAFEVHE